ncbi:hypothetical protein [Nocardia sp. NPDC004711]
MSPRKGGEADKFGNGYEAAWVVARMLNVLAGQSKWLRIEPLGDLGEGVELALCRNDGVVAAHQVKRQIGNANEWTVGALDRMGIWDSLLHHAWMGHEFHFVSMVPFRPLQELADRTRSSGDYASFVNEGLPRQLNDLSETLGHRLGGSAEAYEVLRSLVIRTVDDRELRQNNAVLAALLLDGVAGMPIRASLADLIGGLYRP